MDSLTVGSSVELRGELKPSRGKGQDVEFTVESSQVLGECDAAVSLNNCTFSHKLLFEPDTERGRHNTLILP